MAHYSGKDKIKVAIIGAGIGGQVLSIGLAKYKYLDVQVYEAAAKYLDIGRGLALHGNAIRAMELIDPEIKKVYFRKALSMAEDEELEMATQVILAHGPHSNEVVAQLGRAKGRKTIARADLMNGLLSLNPPERVHFGKRLVAIEENAEGVRMAFEDGTSDIASCLIGFDGVHSCTRRYILGDDHPAANPVNHERWCMHSRMVPVEEARGVVLEKWLNAVPILCRPRGFVNSMPIHYGNTLSISLCRRASFEGGAEPWPQPKDFEDYSGDMRNFVEVSDIPINYPISPWSCPLTRCRSSSVGNKNTFDFSKIMIRHRSTSRAGSS